MVIMIFLFFLNLKNMVRNSRKLEKEFSDIIHSFRKHFQIHFDFPSNGFYKVLT